MDSMFISKSDYKRASQCFFKAFDLFWEVLSENNEYLVLNLKNIEEQAAIYSFVARIDDREIAAQLKEKKKAQQEYSDALQQGHGAYLLEQDEKSQDNFIINVGALPPGKECHIDISYVSELDLVHNGSQIRFVIPTTIAPRYNPDKGGISSPAGTTSKYVQTVPYTIEFHCQLGPLQWLEQHPPGQGRARQIFLLTDGEISNVNEVLDLCRSMATSTRIFSFGLGHSPSRSLVKGLARATNGRFVFIPPNSSVDVHVGEQLQKALQSCITNIEVKWNLGTDVMSAPTKMPPVYVNDRLIVYALASDPMFVFDHNSSIELLNDKSQLGRANIDTIPNVSANGTIARLAAKALILELQHSKLPSSVKQNISGSLQSRFQKDYPSPTPATTSEEKEIIKKRIIDLSLKYQILSPHTAFVGVEKRVNASNNDMVLREVPIQISADDEHLQVPHFMNFSAGMMPRPAMAYRSMAPPMPMASMQLFDQTMDMCFYDSSSMLQSESCLYDMENEDMSPTAMTESNDLMSFTDNANYDTIYSHQQSLIGQEKDEAWPTGDQNIVRYLINKQKFDGLWDLDAKSVEQLTGKPLTSFPSFNNQQVLISAIVVVALETRFATMSTMWHGVVQKARKRLLDLLGKDAKQLQSLLENIRQQF
ncbi:unnamed protein product [Rotaria sp. Silwood1]|nr:unnamed protein product [Rotaria sp. Silwood1]